MRKVFQGVAAAAIAVGFAAMSPVMPGVVGQAHAQSVSASEAAVRAVVDAAMKANNGLGSSTMLTAGLYGLMNAASSNPAALTALTQTILKVASDYASQGGVNGAYISAALVDSVASVAVAMQNTGRTGSADVIAAAVEAAAGGGVAGVSAAVGGRANAVVTVALTTGVPPLNSSRNNPVALVSDPNGGEGGTPGVLNVATTNTILPPSPNAP